MSVVNCPFFPFRTPSLKTVRDLLYKRGYGLVDGKRQPLTDNAYIEKVLGIKTHVTLLPQNELMANSGFMAIELTVIFAARRSVSF